MLASQWDWWVRSDAGLGARVGIGVAIFAALAIVELRRKGKDARRWREYVFLVVCVATAMAYGVLNDLVTASISWEYFYYGKGLDAIVGPQTPPRESILLWHAAMVGLKATWTAGLIGGVAILMANNPRRGRPQLPYSVLYRVVPLLILGAMTCAGICGILGYAGVFARFMGDFADLVREDLFRPHRFMCVYGMHFGAYVGGAIGAMAAVLWVVRRRKLAAEALARCAGHQTS